MALIRKFVLGISQAEMAEIAGTSQPTVSKWEAGELEPDREQLARIRRVIIKKKVSWDDRWFFDESAAAKALAPSEARV